MFDLVVRGGTIATETGTEDADVGIFGGVITACGRGLGPGTREIDATGRLVLPGGVDAHCHVDQRSSSGLMTADDFFTAGVSAACGGTTTIIPFAAQHRGQSLRAVVEAYHERAGSRAFVDYGFHLIVSDPTPAVLEEELPGLVADGQLDLVASDHAPYRLRDPKGKMVHGEWAPFTKIPNGMPGLELRMPLVYSAGVRTGRITLAQFVALTATNPARIHGLYPCKGTIAPGSDADLAIWDTGLERVVAQADLHDAMDDSPFEGRAVTGWPVTTIARGEVVWHEGQVTGEPGRGRFVPRTSRVA